MFEYSFEATGTVWKITFYDEESLEYVGELYKEVRDIISDFESKYSRFIDSSILSSLKNKTGEFNVGEEFIEILKIYFDFYNLSDKKFTPLIGEVLEKLGYDKDYSFVSQIPQDQKSIVLPDLIQAVEIISKDSIKINLPVIFDFGGVGKGFLIQKLQNFLAKKEIQRFCVEGGGDMSYGSGINIRSKEIQKLRVGMQHPQFKNEVIGIVELDQNRSLCSSAADKRKWLEYSHIIDIDNIKYTKNILAVWIVSETASIADTLSTALFFSEPEILQTKFNFEYFILYKDFTFKKSKNFDCETFISNKYC